LLLPQPAQTHHGPQLPGLRLLRASDLDGLLEGSLEKKGGIGGSGDRSGWCDLRFSAAPLLRCRARAPRGADTAPPPTNVPRFGLPRPRPQPGRSIPLQLAPLSRMPRRAVQDNTSVLSRPPWLARRPALGVAERQVGFEEKRGILHSLR
jgi:hypothetical protein